MKTFEYFLNVKRITFLYFSILFIWIGYTLFYLNIKDDGFILGDWLVNYQDGGFKRRGLSGSLFFLIQDITGIRLQILVFVFQMILYFLFFFFLFKILIKKNLSFLYFTLLLSPLTFLLYFNISRISGRKEILIFVIFSFLIYLIHSKKLNDFRFYLICGLIFIATLFHEIVIFYIPYFIFILYIQNEKIYFKKYSILILSTLLPTIAIFFYGAEIEEGQSLNLLIERGVNIQGNSIFKFDNNLFYHIKYYINSPGNYLLYWLSFLLGFIHFFYFIKVEVNQKLKVFVFWFLFCVIFSLPLFVLVIDWGRWLQIHFILLLLIITCNLSNIGHEGPWEKSNLILSNKNFIYMLFVPFLLFWTVNHYGLGFTFKGLFYNVLKKLYTVLIA